MVFEVEDIGQMCRPMTSKWWSAPNPESIVARVKLESEDGANARRCVKVLLIYFFKARSLRV